VALAAVEPDRVATREPEPGAVQEGPAVLGCGQTELFL